VTPSRRRICRSAAACALIPLAATAWAAGARPAVGVLVTDIRRNTSVPILIQGLRDEGYVDGSNITLVIRSADGDPSRLPHLARELVKERPNVIFATGPAVITAVAGATATIPIVAVDLETDPVAAGWARTLARPDRNITGLFLDLPAFAGKWLEIVKEIDPGAQTIGLVWDSSTGSAQLAGAKAAAQRLTLQLMVEEMRTAADLARIFALIERAGVRNVVFMSSPAISQASDEMSRLAIKYRIAAISPFRRFPEAGGLMSYGPHFDDFRQRASRFVIRILKGANPGELPIEQPTKFELVINLKTAKTLGVTFPQAVLLRADEVIA
jgi:putative ABC transport system substrate-binding protein